MPVVSITMDQVKYKILAEQLRNPAGQEGIDVALNMNINNGKMIERTIGLLDIPDGAHILEAGPGNGNHLEYLYSHFPSAKYTGIDYSPTMINEAHSINQDLIQKGETDFIVGNIHKTPFRNESFDAIFTVNTLYFWDNAESVIGELKRIIKPEGRIYISFRSRIFMEQLPFTFHGFTMYNFDDAVSLFESNGWKLEHYVYEADGTMSVHGDTLHKDYYVLIFSLTEKKAGI